MKFIVKILLLTSSLFVHAQIDSSLVKTLDSLKIEDQKWRTFSRKLRKREDVCGLSKEDISRNFTYVDSVNLILVKEIFVKHGFPSPSLVGEDGTHTFWLLVQHADKHPDFQMEVLKKMKPLVDRDEAEPSDYAYLMDRVLVNTGKLQRYGSQCRLKPDGSGHEIKPCEDLENLDKRRAEMGMSPIKRYLEIMDEYFLPKKENEE